MSFEPKFLVPKVCCIWNLFIPLLVAVHLFRRTVFAPSWPSSPSVNDKWINYFTNRIISKHHFKGVEVMINNLKWWNISLNCQLVIQTIVYCNTPFPLPHDWTEHFDLSDLPVIVIHHNLSYPTPSLCEPNLNGYAQIVFMVWLSGPGLNHSSA